MTRIPPAPVRDGLLARVARWFASAAPQSEAFPDGTLFAHHPGLLESYRCFSRGLREAHAVHTRLKALARLRVRAIVGGPLPLDAARRDGVSDDQIADFDAFRSSRAFTVAERAVMEYAEALSDGRVRVPESLFLELQWRFTERQIVELTAAIAWENFQARFARALDHDSAA